MAIAKEERTNSKFNQILPPIAINANKEDIAALDISGFDSVLFMIMVGAANVVPDNDKYFSFALKHSDDNINFTDCLDKEIVGATNGTTASTFAFLKAEPVRETSFMVAYVGPKRYVRPVIKLTGDLGDGVIIGIGAILQDPKYRPVTI